MIKLRDWKFGIHFIPNGKYINIYPKSQDASDYQCIIWNRVSSKIGKEDSFGIIRDLSSKIIW